MLWCNKRERESLIGGVSVRCNWEIFTIERGRNGEANKIAQIPSSWLEQGEQQQMLLMFHVINSMKIFLISAKFHTIIYFFLHRLHSFCWRLFRGRARAQSTFLITEHERHFRSIFHRLMSRGNYVIRNFISSFLFCTENFLTSSFVELLKFSHKLDSNWSTKQFHIRHNFHLSSRVNLESIGFGKVDVLCNVQCLDWLRRLRSNFLPSLALHTFNLIRLCSFVKLDFLIFMFVDTETNFRHVSNWIANRWNDCEEETWKFLDFILMNLFEVFQSFILCMTFTIVWSEYLNKYFS